ncbi:MAG TPA: transketolase C-terminal domain-containing protein [Thermoanaerobaculia bacterium]|jgi:pyruvate/2-oxoglutarate/acetoin dehydrogenase E1 component/TPP-dependent pyruvate/acetoin dehydrogenase alpha subunit
MSFPLADRDASSLPTGAAEAERPGAGSQFTRESILRDYRIAFQSRQASLIGRREVFTGKAKFGIFGDGKEVAQLALARAFRPGDFRSGYYRDQTLMMALGLLTLEQFFAQLYADPDVEREPCSAGRSMTAHFSTCMLEPDGGFRDLIGLLNSSADVSPTGSQMPRLVGLAYASRLYRELPELRGMMAPFSNNGQEIAFGTIGNASCAEGMFWEAVNAIGVLQAPAMISIWDDGYGISVPNEHQITKGDLSALLSGFRRAPGSRQGYDLYTVQGWDYPGLCETYLSAAQIVRAEHVPALVHVVEMTQPQGHSTSGSHERYKSRERLDWEVEFDPIRKMREWMIEQGIATAQELEQVEAEDLARVRVAQRRAWDELRTPIDEEKRTALELLDGLAGEARDPGEVRKLRQELEKQPSALRRDVMAALHGALIATAGEDLPAARRIVAWKREQDRANQDRYSSDLYSATERAAVKVAPVPAVYAPDAPLLNGFEVVNAAFDAALSRFPNLIAFGEDVGKIGDVNQGFAGLQAKYGPLRVSDTGIREATIMGQAIGLALRGLRPIAEIQYLDYVLYGLQILSDDLASLRWRTKGRQKAPVIVRTRGHRLEGIWHSGSPMGGLVNLVRGMYVCVPRNMTQAAGFYNTLLEGDDPALVIEVLNGYRLKERLPANIGEFRVPLGVPEVLREGSDVTVVTYGACCRIALEAAQKLAEVGIEAEVIDVQTLLPFDLHGRIVQSLRKTNRILFLDEDVPGGGTAYMMQKVLEEQGGYDWLDAEPRTLAAREHRPSYGSDGDYFSKPSRESVFETVYELMNEADPRAFPIFYR